MWANATSITIGIYGTVYGMEKLQYTNNAIALQESHHRSHGDGNN